MRTPNLTIIGFFVVEADSYRRNLPTISSMTFTVTALPSIFQHCRSEITCPSAPRTVVPGQNPIGGSTPPFPRFESSDGGVHQVEGTRRSIPSPAAPPTEESGCFLQPEMRPVLVEVRNVGPNDPPKMPLVEHDDMIKTVAPQSSNPSLHERILPRCEYDPRSRTPVK